MWTATRSNSDSAKLGGRWLVGTPDRMAETIGGWKSIGVERFYMQRITTGPNPQAKPQN